MVKCFVMYAYGGDAKGKNTCLANGGVKVKALPFARTFL